MPEVAAHPAALCTVDDVRDLLAGRESETSLSDDATDVIQDYINDFTTRFSLQSWANRELAIEARTLYYSGGVCDIFLPAAPISTSGDPPVPVIEVRESPNRSFADSSILTWGSEYKINRTSGVLTRLRGGCEAPFAEGEDVIKVTWTAGLVVKAGGDIPNPIVPAHLKNACKRQVLAWYLRRTKEDASSFSIPGGPAMDFMMAPDGSMLLKDVWKCICDMRLER